MTASEVAKLSAINYQYITSFNSIAYEIINNGKIISDKRIDHYTELVIKNDNIIYKLLIAGNDTCKSITWERGS